ncbi:MAG: hypothetical protein AAGA68_05460 [Pseudomonadota bacterium]
MRLPPLRTLSLLGTMSLLAACSGGDGIDPIQDDNDAPPPVASTCPDVGNLTPVELGPDQCELGGVLTAPGVLTVGQTWFLEGTLQVGDETNAVTLDIDAGTEIRGDAEGAVDALLVFPGSALRANGTAASPVRLLSDDDGVDGRGEWGGVFLRGFNGLPTLTGTQGANRLDYVVVAEAGAATAVTIDGQTVTYQDNIVLNGVDDTTTLTFVQSHNSARDGFHIVNGDSNPRIVNATLVGRDSASVVGGDADNEFGILFADNTDQIRLGNVLIANFRNGCYEADSGADLSAIDTSTPGPNYLDGVHCANEAGAGGALAQANVPFDALAGGIQFTGELVERGNNFTASWYLDNIRGLGNGLVANPAFLNGFLDGDTNLDGTVDGADTHSPFIIADDGLGGFNQDVASDTGGYDLTHVGSVRGGAVTNIQFDDWTVGTLRSGGFTVRTVQ